MGIWLPEVYHTTGYFENHAINFMLVWNKTYIIINSILRIYFSLYEFY